MKTVVTTFILFVACAIASQACVHCGQNIAIHTFMAIASPIAAAPFADVKAPAKLTKPKTATKSIEAGAAAQLWIDPKEWTISADTVIHGALHNLKHADGNGYAAVIVESQFSPIDAFAKNFSESFWRSDETSVIVSKSIADVNVNGKAMKEITVSAKMNASPLTYKALVFGSSKGMVVLVAFTHTELFEELKPSITGLLSGLTPR